MLPSPAVHLMVAMSDDLIDTLRGEVEHCTQFGDGAASGVQVSDFLVALAKSFTVSSVPWEQI